MDEIVKNRDLLLYTWSYTDLPRNMVLEVKGWFCLSVKSCRGVSSSSGRNAHRLEFLSAALITPQSILSHHSMAPSSS